MVNEVEMSWLSVMTDHAEQECRCAEGSLERSCRSCFARTYVMEHLYGEEMASDLIYGDRPSMVTTPMEMDEREGHVMLDDGVWVPVEDLEFWVDEQEEIDSIIEAFMNNDDSSWR